MGGGRLRRYAEVAADSETVLEAEARARIGTVLRGKWTVDALLDRGGMASVFSATHRNGNRVAIKVLHRHICERADLKDRFLREGYVANKVGHPAALQVLDDDVAEDGAVFLVMELLEGESLEARMRRTRILTPVEALFAADRVLDVLASAHDHGIVHRDVKPANVYITKDGRIKLLDFGLARVREASFKFEATRDGVLLGTAAYMPPEQAQGRAALVDHRSDQWAVGALLFTTLSGRFVHEAKTMTDRIIATATLPARSLVEVYPFAEQEVVDLVDRALSFDKNARFSDCRAMRAAVAPALARAAARVAANPPTSTMPTSKPTSHQPGSEPRPGIAVDLQSVALESVALENIGESIAIDLVKPSKTSSSDALSSIEVELEHEPMASTVEVSPSMLLENVEDVAPAPPSSAPLSPPRPALGPPKAVPRPTKR